MRLRSNTIGLTLAILMATCCGAICNQESDDVVPDDNDHDGPTSSGNVYYVATTGSDSNPGTETEPWLTIQKAATVLTPGDTVHIRAGTYPERVMPQNSGTADHLITFAAYPGDTVTIDGSAVDLPDDLAGLFEINGKSYIRVTGLRIINSRPNADNAGILVHESSVVSVESNSTDHTFSSGIGVWDSHDVTIASNTVENACEGGWQEGISVAGTDTFEVRYNTVHDHRKEGICIKDGSSNGRVHHNVVDGAQNVGFYVDAWDKHTYNIEVSQNTAHDVEGSGLVVASERGGLLENVQILNNIAYHNQYLGMSVSTNGDQPSHPMRNIRVVNNTFYNNGWDTWGGGIAVDNPEAQAVVVRNNICSQNLYFQTVVGSGVPAGNVTVDHNLIDGFRSSEGEVYGDNHVEGDPKFANPAAGDLHLQADSPAIDQGSATDAPATDYDGQARPYGAGYDIGADEYQ